MESKQPFGPSGLGESKFPKFHDGDTKIVITGSRQYQLHSSILRNSSPLFRELLSEKNTAKLSNKAKKKGAVITNMLRASTCRDRETGVVTIELEPVLLNDEGRAPCRIPLDLENGLAVPSIYIVCAEWAQPENESADTMLQAYHKVLGAFYHEPINLNEYGARKLKYVLPAAIEILGVAEYLGCVSDALRFPSIANLADAHLLQVSIITQHFEATLLAMGQDLYRAISADPISWIGVSIRMQSQPLYRESMIHAAGRFNTEEMQNSLPNFDDFTRALLIDMAKVITDGVKKSVSLMLSYYPTGLQRVKRTSLVDKEENSRNSYSNDILHWMALTIFRQWLGHEVGDDSTHNAHDMGHDFMKLIRRGDDAYLVANDLDSWHTFFPMSTRSRSVIKAKLDDIKEYVKRWTSGFFANRSKLDVAKYGLDYFTCAKFKNEQYPWEVTSGDSSGEDDEGSDAEAEDQRSDVADHMEMDHTAENNGSAQSKSFSNSKKSDKSMQLADSGELVDEQPDDPPNAASHTLREYNDSDFEEELRKMNPADEQIQEDAGLAGSASKRQGQRSVHGDRAILRGYRSS